MTADVREYVAMYYNSKRLHSTLDHTTSMDYEKDLKYKDKFMILVVGRLAREKRLHVLINAIENSKYKEKIQMVATGNGPLKEQLIEMGSKLPNPAEFLFVSQKDLIKLYNTADLYVHTSEVELEGMAEFS